MHNRHAIGPMQDIMDVVHITRKGRMMYTLEKFYIFREKKLNNQINDKLTVKPNIIFETIVRHDHGRGLPNSYTQERTTGLSPTRSHFQFTVTQKHSKTTYNRSFTPTIKRHGQSAPPYIGKINHLPRTRQQLQNTRWT
jgi:hypothetical protein